MELTKDERNRIVDRRVEIPVYADLWMQGARYGVITSVAPNGLATVKMDHPQIRRRARFFIQDCKFID